MSRQSCQMLHKAPFTELQRRPESPRLSPPPPPHPAPGCWSKHGPRSRCGSTSPSRRAPRGHLVTSSEGDGTSILRFNPIPKPLVLVFFFFDLNCTRILPEAFTPRVRGWAHPHLSPTHTGPPRPPDRHCRAMRSHRLRSDPAPPSGVPQSRIRHRPSTCRGNP